MGSAVRPVSTTPANWHAFTDVHAYVDEVLAELTAITADDSRISRSAPSCFVRGVDGSETIHGLKVHIAIEKYGIPLAFETSPANPRHQRHHAGVAPGITVEPIAWGWSGRSPGSASIGD